LPILVVLGVILLAALGWAARRYWRHRRREVLFRQPLRGDRRAILERIPLYRRLPGKLRPVVHGLVNIFLDEKRFVGCNGLEITDEMRVVVAGNAVTLLLGRGKRHFPGFQTILVYPDPFVVGHTTYDGVIETHERSVRSGESWRRGPLVLAWSDITDDARHFGERRNVVLHEFAHKLDEENETMDGLPVLRERSQYAEWASVLGREYASLRRQAFRGEDSVLDPYGAVSPAEFFAVATESFFESPAVMEHQLPELYQQLRRFYGLDPAGWAGDRPRGSGLGDRG